MFTEQSEINYHQTIKLLQREIIKQDHTEARLERELTELTSANEQLRKKVKSLEDVVDKFGPGSEQVYKSFEKKISELQSINEELEKRISRHNKSTELTKKKINDLSDTNKQLGIKISELTRVNEKLQDQLSRSEGRSNREIAELTDINRQFQNKLIESSNVLERLEHERHELEKVNRPLQNKIDELTAANEQLQQEVAVSKKAWKQAKQKIDELTAVNEHLQIQGKHDGNSISKKINELVVINKQLEQRLTQSNDALEESERKTIELTDSNKKLKEMNDELIATNHELLHDVEVGKTAWGRARQKIAELTATNECLQNEARRMDESSKQKASELTVISEQVDTKIKTSEKKLEDTIKKIKELSAGNKKLQKEINELTDANKKLAKELEESKKESVYSKEEVPNLVSIKEDIPSVMTKSKGTSKKKTHDRNDVNLDKLIPLADINLKPKSPLQQLRELAEEVVDLASRKSRQDAYKTRKEAILQACYYLDSGNTVMAVDALKRFVNSVKFSQNSNGNIMQKEEAEDLISATHRIINLLTKN